MNIKSIIKNFSVDSWSGGVKTGGPEKPPTGKLGGRTVTQVQANRTDSSEKPKPSPNLKGDTVSLPREGYRAKWVPAKPSSKVTGEPKKFPSEIGSSVRKSGASNGSDPVELPPEKPINYTPRVPVNNPPREPVNNPSRMPVNTPRGPVTPRVPVTSNTPVNVTPNTPVVSNAPVNVTPEPVVPSTVQSPTVQSLPTRPKALVQTRPPDTKALQEKTKVLMEKVPSFGAFVEGSTTSYYSIDKGKVVANAQSMVGILGSNFATRLETEFGKYDGKVAVLPRSALATDATQVASANGGTTWYPAMRAGAIGVQIAKDLGSVLVSDGGQLQLGKGLSDVPTDLCHPSILQDPPLGALRHAEGFVGQLKNNVDLQNVLNDLQAPTSDSGKQIVRNVLGLPPNAPVTATDAKRAMITAMATELRQGSVGSCFATSVGIAVQKSDPLSMMKDLSEIMTSGTLTRNGVTVPAAQKMNSSMLNTPLTDISNLATRSDFQAALQQMGIGGNTQEKINTAAQGLSGENLTPRNILKNLSATTQGSAPQKAARLHGAINAFAGATQNPLLRSWEYTLATLGSDQINSNNKQTLAIGLFGGYVGMDRNSHMGSFLSNQGVQGEALSKATDAIKNAVQTHFGFRYDADIASQGNDGSSDSGTFVLQFRAPNGGRADITTREQYTQVLQRIVETALGKITPTSEALTKAITELPVNIGSIVTSTNKAFDPHDKGYAPWNLAGGGQATDTLKGYYGVQEGKGLEKTKIEFGAPNGNRDGVKFAASMLGAMSGLKDKTQSHVGVSTTSHAFNILPTHETVVPLLGNLGDNPEQAITSHLNSLKQTTAEPKIVLADCNWGGAGGNTFLALAPQGESFALIAYDPVNDKLSPLTENLQEFVNESSWNMTTVEFAA